jgi:hypothetical protein
VWKSITQIDIDISPCLWEYAQLFFDHSSRENQAHIEGDFSKSKEN